MFDMNDYMSILGDACQLKHELYYIGGHQEMFSDVPTKLDSSQFLSTMAPAT